MALTWRSWRRVEEPVGGALRDVVGVADLLAVDRRQLGRVTLGLRRGCAGVGIALALRLVAACAAASSAAWRVALDLVGRERFFPAGRERPDRRRRFRSCCPLDVGAARRQTDRATAGTLMRCLMRMVPSMLVEVVWTPLGTACSDIVEVGRDVGGRRTERRSGRRPA